ncbi:uncharacterized protein LOC132639655 [Lycium barbarum]|uniref:uncharacterized protein LOC132639655 n=1 Tax=Lycium barbarum TaxID=112863 RepID=UPI00293F6D73|nr:uncharacterized protein LOC132639655 [Lycium barbarum]
MDGDYFGILVDESKDISHKEQMTLVLSYVNKEGEVVEHFVGIVHVSDTSARSLKEAVYSFLSNHSLSPSQIRGQGYDGASNMQGKLNGLKTLILSETPLAYCIHYFAHQLQLTLVALAKKNSNDYHYRSLHNLIVLFPSIIHMLEFIGRECPNYTDRLVAKSLVSTIKEFDFTFMLYLMWKVLMMTKELSSSLKRMDQDIVNAMGLLDLTKQRLQNRKDSEFELLMDDVFSFGDKYDIMIPKMVASDFPGKSKRRALDVTYSHHLRVDIFYVVIDLHL